VESAWVLESTSESTDSFKTGGTGFELMTALVSSFLQEKRPTKAIKKMMIDIFFIIISFFTD
jgi:hypothetical protein